MALDSTSEKIDETRLNLNLVVSKMEHYRLNNLDITLEREGVKRFTKASYPIRYGRFCEIETQKYLFQFNLNGEIKYIRGLHPGLAPSGRMAETDRCR